MSGTTTTTAHGQCRQGARPAPRPILLHVVVVAVLGAAAFATYRNSFDAGFVLDSGALILQVRQESVMQILSHDYWWPTWNSGSYRPLTTLSFSLNYSVLGNANRPAGYHWVNLLLHWGNAILVYVVALVLVAHIPSAFFTALLFTTHPVTTEVVTNLVGRGDLLATGSVLGGLLLYVRSHKTVGVRKLPWLLALSLTTAAGLLCRETAIVVVGLIVLYDITFRLDVEEGMSIGSVARRFWQFAIGGWVAVIPPLLLFWGARTWIYRRMAPLPIYVTENHLVAVDFWTARITAIKLLGKSLWLLLWPMRLSWDYSVDAVPVFHWTLRNWDDWQAVVALGALIGIMVLAIRIFRRRKRLFFFVGFWFIAILPTSNLILLIPCVMAERFLYLPLVGFAGGVVLGLRTLSQRLGGSYGERRNCSWPSAVVWIGLGVVALTYGVRSYARNFDWRDDLTIRTRGVEVSPRSFRVHYALAQTLYASGAKNLDRAIAEAETAQAILERSVPPSTPVPAHVLEDLGVYYEAKAVLVSRSGIGEHAGPLPASRAWHRKAIDVLESAAAWNRMANEEHRQIELRRGKQPDEILDVGYAPLYLSLARAYEGLGQPQEALAALVQARHLAPRNADVHAALSSAYATLGDNEDAILSLIQTFIFDQARQEVWPRLFTLYERIDPGGCAFVRAEGDYRFNNSCPIARRHICQAYQRQVEVFREAHDRAAAEEWQEAARHDYGCVPAFSRRGSNEPGPMSAGRSAE
ncbi:MAG: tetratricopeptide repeat protein [Candidatus Binatia bacterium]